MGQGLLNDAGDASPATSGKNLPSLSGDTECRSVPCRVSQDVVSVCQCALFGLIRDVGYGAARHAGPKDCEEGRVPDHAAKIERRNGKEMLSRNF